LAEDVDEDEYTSTVEPPVPAGLARLTGPQQALAGFLHVDPHLLTAAARASGAAPSRAIDKDALAAWIRALPQREKDALLLDAALGTARNRAPLCWPATAPRPVVRPDRPPLPGAAQPRSSSTPPTRCAASTPAPHCAARHLLGWKSRKAPHGARSSSISMVHA
jgi:hypothetical protein